MNSFLVLFLKTHGQLKDLADSLSRVGFKGEGHSDPRSFLARLKERAPLACVVDAAGEDATKMLALIKIVRGVLAAKMPLIAIVADKDAESKALAMGATVALLKPWADEALISAVVEHAASENDGQPAVQLPKGIKWFFDVLSPALASMSSVLDTSTELEAQVKFCEVRLMPFRDLFIGLVRSIRKTDAKLDLVQCIRMYGIRNCRNLIVSMKLSEVVGQPLVGFNAKQGALVGDPAGVLKYANRTLDHFEEGSRNQFEAYNAGLVIDLLWAAAETVGPKKSAVRTFIEDRYIEAMKHVDDSIDAAKAVKNLAMERHIVSSILMREAGRIAMAIHFPEYMGVRWRLEKKTVRPVIQHIVELRQFNTSHNLMGALICQGAPGLGDAYKSVLFFDYPYMLRDLKGAADSFDLVRVCGSK